MESGTSFNSKLLLFGEYGLMFDAMALSVPFSKFWGELSFDNSGKHLVSNAEIRKFCNHLKQESVNFSPDFSFNLEKLEADLGKGMYFDSNIPQQYGVGSSGALVAALFSRYGKLNDQPPSANPEILKTLFAKLESFFHGRSSGLDPLISFLDKPVLIDSKKQITVVDFDFTQAGLAIGLIDTKTTGATGPLVQHFIDRFNDPEFEQAFESQFIPANNGCINAIINNYHELFFNNLTQLIHFQLKYFRRMIPEQYYPIMGEAPGKGIFIKLLGSGGGGFLLAFARSQENLITFAQQNQLDLLPIA